MAIIAERPTMPITAIPFPALLLLVPPKLPPLATTITRARSKVL
jgi:hypothetical protein